MAATRMGSKPKNISRTKALGRLYQAAKSPAVDRGRAAKNIAPAEAKTKADFRAQKRWWAAPTQMDFENVDTPSSPPLVTKTELAIQEELAETLEEPKKEGKLDANVIESVTLVGANAYLNGEHSSPKQAPYLQEYIHKEGFSFSEEQKINEAFKVGWLSEKDKAKAKKAPAMVTKKPIAPPKPGQIKASPSPLDANGKPLIKAFNIKKLEDLAKAGNEVELLALGEELESKMLSKAKKAAVQNAVQELLGQMNGHEVIESSKESGYTDLIDDVHDGDQKLPSQSIPSNKTIAKEEAKWANDKKNYDADLEQVSGKKGSNEGGLFKDKHLQTFHYIKWPGEDRARMEVLANTLYSYAGTPVPGVRLITFQGKPAIMSDWIDGVQPMTFAEMAKHPDVRRNFVVDAWLANWDAVGMGADNIVVAPNGTAYRIDPGGSLIYRAQGAVKPFPSDAVNELETMRSPSTAPQASKVFGKLTQSELKAGAKSVSQVTDQQIDAAVNAMFEPDTNVGKSMKAALKQRRDIITEQILNAEPPVKLTAAALGEKLADEKLSKETLKLVAKDGAKFSTSSTGQFRATRQRAVLVNELGEDEAPKSNAVLNDAFQGWKAAATTTYGAFLRWAIARSISKNEGDNELDKMRRFWTVQKYGKNHGKPKSEWEQPNQAFKDLQVQYTKDLTDGLDVTRAVNHAVQVVQTGGKDKMTIYRIWKPDQVKYMDWDNLQVGDIIELDKPTAFSWSFSPDAYGGTPHGGMKTKAEVSLKDLYLSDRVNNVTGIYAKAEDEVIFKGGDVRMEVTKKP